MVAQLREMEEVDGLFYLLNKPQKSKSKFHRKYGFEVRFSWFYAALLHLKTWESDLI